SPELAAIEVGRPVILARLGLTLLIALMVAAAMQVVGLLLITSMLIIPAAAARADARTPEQIAVAAAVVAVLAVVAGLQVSLHADTPAGPSVVVAALAAFLLLQAGGWLFRRMA